MLRVRFSFASSDLLTALIWIISLGSMALPAGAQETAAVSGLPWLLISVFLAVALATVVVFWAQREKKFAEQLELSEAGCSADLAASQDQLAVEAEVLSALLESVLEAIVSTDSAGRIQRVNRAAETLLGAPASQLVGQRVAEAMPLRGEDDANADFDPIAELRRSLSPKIFDSLFHFTQKSGDRRRLELSGTPVTINNDLEGFVLAVRDVTDRHLVEAELAKAQKLESLGLLASGIAHDFNNLLTIVLGNFSLLPTDEELPSSLREPLDEIEKALVRARGLSDQLLTFASGGVPRNRPTNLAELVAGSVAVVFRGDESLYDLDIPDDLREVDADPEQIGQVLNNLLLEARQAPGAAKVRVSAKPVRIGLGKTKLRPGSYIRLEVFDGGEGLPPEEVAKIFDPYVSPEKGGTGLGLATSQAIVKRHRGAIEVTSEPGVGTTFAVLLRTAKASRELRTESPAASRRSPSGRGRVLVMDDEHSILTLMSAALKRLGFDVVTTLEGSSALEACRAAQATGAEPFHMAVLDLTIPGGMGGVETAAKLRDLQPDLLLVASSGYSQNPALIKPREHGFDDALVKPYRIPDLARLVDRLLGPSA